MHKAQQQQQQSFTNRTRRIGTPLTLAQRLRNAILKVFKRELTLTQRLNIAVLSLFKRGLTLPQRLQIVKNDHYLLVAVPQRILSTHRIPGIIIVEPVNHFFISKINFMAKKQNKARIQNDPSFERTRENAEEFSAAASAARLVRETFRSLIKSAAASKSLVGRMQTEMMKVLKSDSTSDRGKRLVSKGDFSMLKGFEFNDKSSLDAVFLAKFSSTADRTTGKLTIQFPPFFPSTKLSAPIAATHFRIVSSAAELDIEKDEYVVHEATTATLPLQNLETTIPNLENQLTANTQKALLWLLCVEFFQEVNGKMYLLKTDARNPLKVIHAESAVA